MWRVWLMVLLVVPLTSCGSIPASLNVDIAHQIQNDFQAALSTFDVPGAAFALVWPDGEYGAGVGLADIPQNRHVTSESRFAVASAIKPVIGAWIARQIETGAVTWETRLADLWPELNLGAAGDVTIYHAVHQTSGFPREDWAWLGRDVSLIDLAAMVREVRQVAPTGRAFTYHNIIFVLALRGIEARTGQLFSFQPSDVTGYDRALGGEFIPLTTDAHQNGAMSIVLEAGLSATDAIDVLRVLLSEDAFFTAQTVGAGGAMCCPLGADVRYGRAMFVEQYAGVTLWLHDGDGLGFTSVIMVDPVAKIGVFIAANRGDADDFVHAMRYTLIERLYDLPSAARVALEKRWEHTRLQHETMTQRLIPVPRSDQGYEGEYQTDLRLIWHEATGFTLQRGGFVWQLRPLAAGYWVFDHGPLIGQPVDLVCADGRRRVVSGGTVLGIGKKC